jgi:hypothetical protein
VIGFKVYVKTTISQQPTIKFKMKHLTIALFALLVSMSSVSAQGNGSGKGKGNGQTKVQKTPEEIAKMRLDKLSTSIGLTDEQKVKITPMIVERVNAIREARKSTPPNKEAMKAAKVKFREGLKSTLTPEQITKLKAMNKERKGNKVDKKDPKPSSSSEKNDDDLDLPDFE